MNGLENFDWDNYDSNVHPFVAETVKQWSLEEFLDNYVTVYKDTVICAGRDSLEEWPALIFKNYNCFNIKVINLKNLSFFQILKFKKYLTVEKKKSGFYLLSGDLPEDYDYDECVLERWENIRKESAKRKGGGIIPNVIGVEDYY